MNIVLKGAEYFCIFLQWLNHYSWFFVFIFPPLLTTNAAAMQPIVVMAILGLYQLIRQPSRILADSAYHPLIFLFLCIWLPILFSLPDSITPVPTLHAGFTFLLYFLSGIVIFQVGRETDMQNKLLIAITLVAGFCAIDGIVQLVLGRNLFGYPLDEGNISGVFYPKLRLGHILAVFSPLYFEGLRRYIPYQWLIWILALLLVLVILFTGRRVAWIMLSIASIFYGVYCFKMGFWQNWKKHLSVIGIGIILLIPIILLYSPFSQRIAQTLGLFTRDYQAINLATSYRLPLWNTAYAISKDHWLNGTGVRGFREACKKYADKNPKNINIYEASQPIYGCSTHPHSILLEISTEVGLIGIMGYFLFGWLFWRYMKKVPPDQYPNVIPWAITVLVAVFPLDAHMAFYGSYWSSTTWWLIALTLAKIAPKASKAASNLD
ncbi:O-antigen ligase family protein [Candidatus Nitrosacidococcus tergens]|uniref:Putative O-antigen polymerase n=1 Tax=Candidatus Nitrosacidococcus tergens TaxID=553981 RepID=A0A7G1QAR0_9GAMM|nr:O-antigen ligase family protein [Candidatus Nitrosacidococcus tergens]CAB1276859.1 putative O-antigen polymerase [Candidatus Nitrosacidococcus tergens]